MMSVIYTLSYIHHLSMWWSLYIGLPQTASLVSGGEGNVERDFYLLFHFTHFNHWSVKPVQFLSVCYVCWRDIVDDPSVVWSRDLVSKLLSDYVKNYLIDVVSELLSVLSTVMSDVFIQYYAVSMWHKPNLYQLLLPYIRELLTLRLYVLLYSFNENCFPVNIGKHWLLFPCTSNPCIHYQITPSAFSMSPT